MSDWLLSFAPRWMREAIAPPKPRAAFDAWASNSVHLLSLGLTAGFLLAAIHNTIVGRYFDTGALLVEIGVVQLAVAANRRGATERAAGLLAVSLPLVATALMLTSSGMRDVASLMLPASLIVCGLLLNRSMLAVVALLSMVCAAVAIAADAHGVLPGSPDGVPWLRQSLDAASIIGVTALGVGLVSERLRRSYELLRRDQVALRASEERYRSLIDLAADAICIQQADGRIVEVNRRLAELTGYSHDELVGRPFESLLLGSANGALLAASTATAAVPAAEAELVHQDGSTVPVEVSSMWMPDGTCQRILRDISERRRAEAARLALESRLRESQKMEAIGRLAGGIAHDFNNLLTAITGSLTLAMRDVPPGVRAHRWLAEVESAAWRAAGLTRQLLAFSRKQAIALKIVDVCAVVEGIRPMLARLIGEDIELRAHLAPGTCLAEVDQGQIEQVLLNLAANARDAMPDGGLLQIDVTPTTVNERYLEMHPEAHRGRHVRIDVRDSGQGMTEEVRSHVFEPFFTTKPAGSGTGFGLATVYGLVQQNRGWIEVDSAPGRGTRFRIFLPRAEGAVSEEGQPVEEPPLGGSETILFVEDEAPVRNVTTAQLESLGYHVISCSNGQAALAAARVHAARIDLLLTDVVMPGMNGRELAERLTQSRPGLRILFTSGHGEGVLSRQPGVAEKAPFLEKPHTLNVLARKVRESLEG